MVSTIRAAVAAAAFTFLTGAGVASADGLHADGFVHLATATADWTDVGSGSPQVVLPHEGVARAAVSGSVLEVEGPIGEPTRADAELPAVSSGPLAIGLEPEAVRDQLTRPGAAALDEIRVTPPFQDAATAGQLASEAAFALLLALGSGGLVALGLRAH